MKRHAILTLLLSISISFLNAQDTPIPTTAEERQIGYERRILQSNDHLLSNLEFESIGPTIMGGLVTDISVSPSDPTSFYIAVSLTIFALKMCLSTFLSGCTFKRTKHACPLSKNL